MPAASSSKAAPKSGIPLAKTKRPILIALDMGFGWGKLLSSAGIQYVFPSIVVSGQPSTKLFNFDEINRQKLVVTIDGKTHMVGDQARTKTGGRTSNRTEARDRATDTDSQVLFRTAIALGVPDEEGEYDVILETGVPNEDYGKIYADKLVEYLKQSFEITFNLGHGKTVIKKINVIDVDIIRQPEGTVLDHTYRFNPNYREEKTLLLPAGKAPKYHGVIDIGQGTTDAALFEDGFIREEEGTSISTEATNLVYDKLRTKLAIKFAAEGYEYKATDTDLDVMIRTKSLWYAGETHDVTPEITESVEEVAELIVDEVTRAWGSEIQRLQGILITGGGADIFFDSLVLAFKSKNVGGLFKAEMAQYSNVIGFYEMAVLNLVQKGMPQDEIFEEYVVPFLQMLEEAV
ncbi:ParM/StbA family protein (plasmid) [Paenibacillus rhizovicinus]|uniref:ParM/StbA family protein n=1 Tax=Paenibacillus rhizovicinus TaxID=2704463 RepID=A0A6C0PB71_9BACL|nr:ParM/StbA family protein [Paenibacillus rhizovicinus]QHW35686.1 ParM/StbA family protein [Paenibacillus rhizovicinus]